MSAIRSHTPLPVLPYATSLAPAASPGRLLRAGTRFGFFACALTLFFVPIWFWGDSLGPIHFWQGWMYEDRIAIVVPFLQALFMGAGLALTVAGRPANREVRRHPRYALALLLNLLVFIAVYCEWTIPAPTIPTHGSYSSVAP